MYGELTEKEAVERVDRALDHHLADQFEILLYKKNRTCRRSRAASEPARAHRPLLQARRCGCWCTWRPSAMSASWWCCSCSRSATSRRSSSPSTPTTQREASIRAQLAIASRLAACRRVPLLMCVCVRRAVEVREAGALGDALALGAGVGAASAEGTAACEPPGACQYSRTPCKHRTLHYALPLLLADCEERVASSASAERFQLTVGSALHTL